MEASPFGSASASPYGLRSSRTEHYPLKLNVPRVGQIKPPKWARPTCQKQSQPLITKAFDKNGQQSERIYVRNGNASHELPVSEMHDYIKQRFV
jgi:hypothetical protein